MGNWEDNVRRVTPYVPGEQPRDGKKVIKLNTNEMPYPPSPKVKEALAAIDYGKLRLYPAPDVAPLRDALAEREGVTGDEMFVGVGSDDVLSMAFLTFFNSDKPVIFPDITYSFYDVWADVYRIPYETKALNDDFHIVKSDYMCENGGIVIANPNAPTGVSESGDVDFIEDIVAANQNSVVIVDEAYVDFGGVTALPLIKKYDNILIVRTFSKSRAFAGVRIGYAMGSRKLIRFLNDVKYSVNSYTMNRPAIELGVAALSDEDYFNRTIAKVIRTREWTKAELKNRSFTVTDSRANFVFASPKSAGYEAGDLFVALKDKGIYVRWWGKDRIRDWLRISIGTDEEMQTLLRTIDEIMQNRSGIG